MLYEIKSWLDGRVLFSLECGFVAGKWQKLRSRPMSNPMPFPIWLARVANDLRAAGLGALNFRHAVEYWDNGYTPDEVVSIEAREATAAENARMETDGEYGREWRYP